MHCTGKCRLLGHVPINTIGHVPVDHCPDTHWLKIKVMTCSLLSFQMMVVLVDKLLKTQIVEPSAVANWLFSSEMQPEFTKSVVQSSWAYLCFNI